MVNIEQRDHIIILKLNRIKVHHAINEEVATQLLIHLQEIKRLLESGDEEIKGVMITSVGSKSFCSGGDVRELHQASSEKVAQYMHKMKEVLWTLFTMPCPTVAALNGHAFGGGCEIAAACDFRVAAEHVKCGFIQIKLGISTGWGGSTYLYQRLSAQHALGWLVSGEILTSQQAKELGFIDTILPSASKGTIEDLEQNKHFIERTIDWMKRWSSYTPHAIKVAKINYLNQLDMLDIQAKLDREVQSCMELWDRPEHHHAVEKFLKDKGK